jgi:hypothetical protein
MRRHVCNAQVTFSRRLNILVTTASYISNFYTFIVGTSGKIEGRQVKFEKSSKSQMKYQTLKIGKFHLCDLKSYYLQYTVGILQIIV